MLWLPQSRELEGRCDRTAAERKAHSASRNAIPSKRASSRHLNRPEPAPWRSAGAQTYTEVRAEQLHALRNRKREERPASGRARHSNVKKDSFWHLCIYTYLLVPCISSTWCRYIRFLHGYSDMSSTWCPMSCWVLGGTSINRILPMYQYLVP